MLNRVNTPNFPEIERKPIYVTEKQSMIIVWAFLRFWLYCRVGVLFDLVFFLNTTLFIVFFAEHNYLVGLGIL